MVLYKELMQEQKALSVSVVIPCYNEQDSIARCLSALQNQTKAPYEVIVVDNNCTDKTVAIARLFGAKVVRETTQGLVAARNAGMNAASGGIIARIDADSVAAPHWVDQIAKALSDKNLQAVTGTGYFYDLPLKRFATWFRNLFAVKLNRLLLGHNMLWGSNMAVRTDAWRMVRTELCAEKDLMEDLDIAMHLADRFGTGALCYDPQMRADISARRATTGFMQNFLYLKMWPRTLKKHRFISSFLAWPAVGLLIATGVPITNTVSRFYDGEHNEWVLSWRQFRGKYAFSRENP